MPVIHLYKRGGDLDVIVGGTDVQSREPFLHLEVHHFRPPLQDDGRRTEGTQVNNFSMPNSQVKRLVERIGGLFHIYNTTVLIVLTFNKIQKHKHKKQSLL